MSTDYWELLKDPRWQRKRLEVMERADFRCEDCHKKDKTLTVHHTYYEFGLDPWDYPTKHLRCLCEDCHKIAQFQYKQIKRLLGDMSPHTTERLLLYATALAATDPRQDGDGYEFQFDNYSQAEGIADAFNLTPDEVIYSGEDGNTPAKSISDETLDRLWSARFVKGVTK